MLKKNYLFHFTGVAGLLGLLTIAAPVSAASHEQVLYSFCNGTGSGCPDGEYPRAGVIFDSVGNLYGTTEGDDVLNYGNVFQLTPGANGSWTETVLYNFGSNGILPVGALVFDASGNLYGTTLAGGDYNNGTVFELTPTNGTWTEQVLYSFGANPGDGTGPASGLIFDGSGNLYGTTPNGGRFGTGTVFELSPSGNGTWSEKVLYSFSAAKYGRSPSGILVFDVKGNLYGVTSGGGAHRGGTVFELTPGKKGSWREQVLHSFSGKDGRQPIAGLTFDANGNLYGTAAQGGARNGGVVFELSPGGNGTWTEQVLHYFGHAADGARPASGLTFDGSGNLYGTTRSGGSHGGGIAFELSPGSSGKWTERVLHNFGKGEDAAQPVTSLVFDGSGNLYGTAQAGGASQFAGAVFEITP